MGFIEQMLGMEGQAAPTRYRQGLMGPRGGGAMPGGSQGETGAMAEVVGAMPGQVRDWAQANPLDAAALGASVIPVVGDIAGFANDMRHMVQKPEERTWTNAGLAAAGLLPGVPPMAGMIRGSNRNRYDIDAGSKPEYLGAATDRSDYSYLRHIPGRGVPERTSTAIDALRANRGGMKDQMLADIRRGEELGGNDWYNTEELRDWFVAELGPERGPAEWKEFMEMVGAGSPASKVDQNLKVASAMRQRLGNDPQYLSDTLASTDISEARRLAKGRPEGYGHYAAGAQEMGLARQQRGEWHPDSQLKKVPAKDSTAHVNAKPKGFKQSLIGNTRNIAADIHFTRYMAMASGNPDWIENGRDLSQTFEKELRGKYGNKINKYITTGTDTVGNPTRKFAAKDAMDAGTVKLDDYQAQPGMYADKPRETEYKAFEDYINEIGKELNMSAAQVQANLWMGAADKTRVAESSQGTFMELLRNRADKRAKEIGSTRSDVLQDFIKNKGLLAVPAIGLGSILGTGGVEGGGA